MTDVDIYQPPSPIRLADRGITAADRDIVDGWVAIASDVIKVANVVAETEFVPKEYRGSPPAVAAAILTGRELGIGPMMSLRHVQIVRGVPTLSAEYKRGRVLAAGHDFEVLELTVTRCRVRGRRAGTPKWLETTFTMDDAKRAKIVKADGAWVTRPRRMLFARAGSELCDFLFADVTNGLPTAELVAEGAEGDEFAGYDESPAQAAPAADGEPPKPAQRTARRRQARQEPADHPSPAVPATAPEARTADRGPAPAQTAPSGQPPLPGEDEAPDETDYDTPATVTKPQLTKIATVFSAMGFTNKDRDQRLAAASQIVGRPLSSGNDLSVNEAKVLIDTLERCGTRENLVALLATQAQDDDAEQVPDDSA